jgi:hypothetical protein
VLSDLGYEDVHFAPEQDLEKLIMKNIKMASSMRPRLKRPRARRRSI